MNTRCIVHDRGRPDSAPCTATSAPSGDSGALVRVSRSEIRSLISGQKPQKTTDMTGNGGVHTASLGVHSTPGGVEA